MTKSDVVILPNELKDELQKIALGACFLGSGGGGGLETSFTFIKNYCDNLSEDEKKRNLQIADLEAVTAGQTGIVVAYMGAPQKADSIKCPDAICDGIEKFKKCKGIKDINYIIPVEIGPGSTIAACLTAHKKGRPVLDVDGAGRAVPTLDLITYGMSKWTSVNPTILCSENHHQVTLEISDEKDDVSENASTMESLARPVLCLPLFDQKAGLVMWYFPDVTKLREPNACVPGTLTFCRELGGAIQSMQKQNVGFPEIENLFSKELFKSQSIYPEPVIKEICRGTLDSATTSTAGGFDGGVITIKGDSTIKDYSGHQYTIIFQNESLILWDSKSAEPLVMAPNLISYLIAYEKYVFTNGDIMRGDALKKELKGATIAVYSIAAPNALRTSKMLCNTMKVLNTLGYYGNYDPFKNPFNEPLEK